MSDFGSGTLSIFLLFSYIYWVRSMFFNIFFAQLPWVERPPAIPRVRVRRSLSVALSRTPSGFWAGDMKNPFPGTAGEGRVRATHRGYFNPSTRQAMLSSEFWRNFLPAGKDFTIPAPNFLPAGIPFLELPKQGQSVRRFPRFDRFHPGDRRNLI